MRIGYQIFLFDTIKWHSNVLLRKYINSCPSRISEFVLKPERYEYVGRVQKYIVVYRSYERGNVYSRLKNLY